jgi:flagella basal body P-ring formation protein FlgA
MMRLKATLLIPVLALLGAVGPACAAGNWNLVMPDTVVLTHDLATLEDIASCPVPAYVQDIVIRAGLEPNSVVTVSRQDVLRRLVTAGLAHGVKLTGAERSYLVFAGHQVDAAAIQKEVRQAIQPLVPPAFPGAPDSWFELELPELQLSVADSWKVEVDREKSLEPGRNLVRINVRDNDRTENFAAVAILHQFGEVGRLRQALTSDQALEENLFDWQWKDLADLDHGLAVYRSSIAGASAVRNLKAGDYLREADLKETPVILVGDEVELLIKRRQVAVTVRAFARQNGCLGQIIPVRNELTGRMVNARVAGPGRVEWRK